MSPKLPRSISLCLLLAFLPTGVALSGQENKAPEAKGGRGLAGLQAVGLPAYVPAPSFREDLVITTEGKSLTMRRYVDHRKIRTEMSAEGRTVVMVETGDERSTMYTLMPEQKRAMKQSREGMRKAMPRGAQEEKAEPAQEGPPRDFQIEDLGDETLDGNAVKKLRMNAGQEGSVLGWFDKATGAPIKMESVVDGKKAALEWKNRKAEPQPADLFAVPKDYEVTDLDQMMAEMGGMGAGGMAKGMAGGMIRGMGESTGGSLGAALGGSLGGPLGAAAGQFIGGRIGGMLGGKAANAVR